MRIWFEAMHKRNTSLYKEGGEVTEEKPFLGGQLFKEDDFLYLWKVMIFQFFSKNKPFFIYSEI